MGTARIDLWLGRIELEVQEAPVPLVQQALMDALQMFCQGGKAWRQDLDLIDAVAGPNVYTPATPGGSRLAGIRRMLFNGNKVVGRGEEWLDDNLQTDWRSQTSTTPEYYYQPQRDQFALVFAPAAALTDGIYVRAYLKPSLDAEEVPDLLWEEVEYRQAIEAGAKATLFRMEGTAWENVKAAESWAEVFQAGMELARGHAERDNTEEIMTMMTSPFGGIPNG